MCFNYRTDRCREISEVLTQQDFPAYDMKKLNICYTTLTEYDKSFKNVHVVFQTDNLNNTLGEVLAANQQKTNYELPKQKSIRMLLSFLVVDVKFLLKVKAVF